jgi:hypothetical protein
MHAHVGMMLALNGATPIPVALGKAEAEAGRMTKTPVRRAAHVLSPTDY